MFPSERKTTHFLSSSTTCINLLACSSSRPSACQFQPQPPSIHLFIVLVQSLVRLASLALSPTHLTDSGRPTDDSRSSCPSWPLPKEKARHFNQRNLQLCLLRFPSAPLFLDAFLSISPIHFYRTSHLIPTFPGRSALRARASSLLFHSLWTLSTLNLPPTLSLLPCSRTVSLGSLYFTHTHLFCLAAKKKLEHIYFF